MATVEKYDNSAWRATKQQRERRKRLMDKYGLHLEEFEILFERQAGRCAICKRKLAESRGIAIDHCHTRGVVRGLLCAKCNAALGLFDEDAERLRKAARYIEESWEGTYPEPI